MSARQPSKNRTKGSARRAPRGGPPLRNLTKVTPPILSGVYPNERLFEHIDAAKGKPITWIHGPPGAGKTTLVASYLSARGVDPLWYRLDEGDADPATLFFYIATAWASSDRSESLPLFKPGFGVSLPLFSRRFFRSLFAHPAATVAVFDDYHEVALDALLHQCMANGLEEVPTGCRVIIASRAPPPPSLARLRLNGLLAVIEPDELRITLDEAAGVSRQRGVALDAASVRNIVRQTQGWTAGLILMLEAGTDTVVPAHSAGMSDVLFDYFAGEIFQRMEPRTQRLLCLLAVMPSMTAQSAVRLTGAPEAAPLLEDLRRRNYFTTRDLGDDPHYRFHPLFRDFLLETGRTLLAGEDLSELRIEAAKVLEDDGQTEAAVALLNEDSARALLIDLVKRHAGDLIEKGRDDTLLAWLGKLPDEAISADGWLGYWLGAAQLYRHPTTALPLLRHAFMLFDASDDAVGLFTAWAAQAEAVRVDAVGSVARFDRLIEDLRALLVRHPDIPSGNVLLSVAMGAANALSRRGSDRAEIARWQQIARTAAQTLPGRGLSIQIGFLFVISALQDADHAEARRTLEALPDPLATESLSYVQGTGVVAHAVAIVFRQRPGDCAPFFEEAIRKLEEGGYVQWAPMVATLASSEACQRGDIATCGAWLDRAAALADRVAPMRPPLFHSSMAQYLILTGDLSGAARHARTAIELSVATGWYVQEILGRLALTEVLIDTGAFDEAAAELEAADAALARSASAGFASAARLLRADLALARGETAAGAVALADAVGAAARQNDPRIYMSVPRLSRLLGLACRLGIETAYVRRFIRVAGLPAPDPLDETWPWPLKIATFGRLTVECDGAPLVFPRKTPKRLITLLKAIVAYGGRDVPDAKLIDAVWPDEDGDAAIRALRVAVHRLRRLLGDTSVVTWKGGRLGLDPSQVWLDLWAFDHHLARRVPGESDEAFKSRCDRALRLYNGEFLGEDDDLWWTRPRRDKCRRALSDLGSAHPDH